MLSSELLHGCFEGAFALRPKPVLTDLFCDGFELGGAGFLVRRDADKMAAEGRIDTMPTWTCGFPHQRCCE